MDQRGAGRRPPLTRETVLRSALGLVDEEGLDALTMRRLGQRLERDPMALYRHAQNRAELLDGLVETVLSELEPPDASAPWQTALRETARRFRALALLHPNVVPLLATRPLVTPLGLRPVGALQPLEQILAVLTSAGFTPTDALQVYRTYFALLIGHVLVELQRVVVDPDETDAVLRLALHRLPAREFPHLRALADALDSADGAAELDQGIDMLLSAFQERLGPRGPSGQPSAP